MQAKNTHYMPGFLEEIVRAIKRLSNLKDCGGAGVFVS